MSHWGHRVESLAMQGQESRRTPWNNGTMALGLLSQKELLAQAPVTSHSLCDATFLFPQPDSTVHR